MSQAQWSARTTDSAANRATICMLKLQDPDNVAVSEKLRARAAEVGHKHTLECIEAIENFRELPLESMPTEAHDIVDRFMASDTGPKVFFSSRVQQELINTP